MARPRIKLNEEDITKLAALACTTAEIASYFGCHPRTLERRFAAALKRGRDQGKMSLRRKQYEIAQAGNVTMLIWLGKQMLGQKDKVETTEKPFAPAEELTDAELEAIASRGREGTARQASGTR